MLEGLYTAAAGMAAQRASARRGVERHRERQHRRLQEGPHRLPRPRLPGEDGPSGVRTGSGAAVTQLGRVEPRRARSSRPTSRSTSPSRARATSRSAAPTASSLSRARRVPGRRERRQLVNPNGERLVAADHAPAGVDPAQRVDRPRRRRDRGRAARRPHPPCDRPRPQRPRPGRQQQLPRDRGQRRTVRAAGDRDVQQGALESSNVDLADAMVDMMDAQRSYQMAQPRDLRCRTA